MGTDYPEGYIHGIQPDPLPDLETARERVDGTLSVTQREYRAALSVIKQAVAASGTTNLPVVVPNGSTNS